MAAATAKGFRGDQLPEAGDWAFRCAAAYGASHTFPVLSALAEARRLPSGLKHTEMTRLVCGLRERVSCPVAASHSFTVLSPLAEARHWPSGLKHTQITALV